MRTLIVIIALALSALTWATVGQSTRVPNPCDTTRPQLTSKVCWPPPAP